MAAGVRRSGASTAEERAWVRVDFDWPDESEQERETLYRWYLDEEQRLDAAIRRRPAHPLLQVAIEAGVLSIPVWVLVTAWIIR